MKSLKFISSFLLGLIGPVIVCGSAYAWSPSGTISKSVQDLSANTALVAASNAATALTVKPGDVLRYEVVITNNATLASDNQNDMANTILTDTLPSGVDLISSPGTNVISENIGTILPGQSAIKDYTVRVAAQDNGAILINQACFTANSIVNDSPQSGCAVSEVKVNVPIAAVAKPSEAAAAGTSTTPSKPVQAANPSNSTSATPPTTQIPNTGPGNLAAPALGLFTAFISYLAYAFRLKRQIV